MYLLYPHYTTYLFLASLYVFRLPVRAYVPQSKLNTYICMYVCVLQVLYSYTTYTIATTTTTIYNI